MSNQNMNKLDSCNAEWVDVYCLSVQQLCASVKVEQRLVYELVECDVLKPQGENVKQWLFHPSDLSRLNKAARLMHEFELSPVGLALVFDLLDELQQLREI